MSKMLSGTPILTGDNNIPGVKIHAEVKVLIPAIEKACRNMGLDYYPIVVEFMRYDEISELASYGGFPVRYPHWRWGMEYEELSTGYEFGKHRISEMVINCLAVDTKVTTARGTINAEDVIDDDIVFANGKRQVAKVIKQPIGKRLAIKIKGRNEVTVCSPNHRWQVMSNSGPIWIQTKDIKSGDFIVGVDAYNHWFGSPSSIKWSFEETKANTVPCNHWRLKNLSLPKQLSHSLAELMGAIVGDGSQGVKSRENMVSVTVGKGFPMYKDHITRLFRDVFDSEPLIEDKGRAWEVTLCAKLAVNYLTAAGLIEGVTCKHKRIPSSVWASSPEYRCSFLRGYFDTDGFATDVLGVTSTSEMLLNEVQLMLAEMGIYSVIDNVNNDCNKEFVLRISGQISLCKFRDRIGFSIDHKIQGLSNLLNTQNCTNRGFKVPFLQKQILDLCEVVNFGTAQSSLYRSWRNMQRNSVGFNAMVNFLFRAIHAGYTQFSDLLSLFDMPLWKVESIEEVDKGETIDIALWEGHDFIANGMLSHNTDPCEVFCLDSNTLVDNIDVISHAIGHNDFFKNNIFFAQTNRKMMDKMANHGTRIRKYMARWGSDKVIEFIDHVLRLDTLIDPSKAWEHREIKDVITRDERKHHEPERLVTKHNYMEDWVNPKEARQKEKRRAEEKEAIDYLDIFRAPDRDIFGYLKNHAPLKPWQQDIVAMLYDEAMYFAPQRQTKMLNEGWACVLPGTLMFTSMGILPAEEIVRSKLSLQIDDTEQTQNVNNWFTFQHKNTVMIETKRGYQIGGSHNHRIWNDNKDWVCLEDIDIGDKLKITASNLWTQKYQEINWEETDRLTYRHAKGVLGKKYWRFHWYRCGKIGAEQAGADVVKLSKEFDRQVTALGETQPIRRKSIKIPSFIDEKMGCFLGYMIGDGHISVKKRTMGLATGDLEQGDAYTNLVWELFGLKCDKRWDNSSLNGRWRINVHSLHLQDFLVHLGLKTGVCAREKTVPECVLRSPKSVVSAFMRAYFDCDGYAGKAGVILSTASTEIGKQIQTILLNYGILSTRRQQSDGCWHVRITGKSAIKFKDEIGFGLRRKQLSLEQYINNHKFFCEEKWEDKVVDIEFGHGTVYDISVENTHRYVAHGFVNHNSYVDYNILCRYGLVAAGQPTHDCGIWEYARHKMMVLGGKYSQNPYKLGYELFLDIEDRWNKGRFGTEYDECTDMKAREKWDKQLGLGKEKVFEVRKYYNDFTALSEFFTPEFCEEKQFYEYRKFPNGEWKIVNRDFKSIKKNLLQKRLNAGLPDVKLVDPNHLNKGWFLLQHYSDGRPLYDPYVREVMSSIFRLWGNVVVLHSKSMDGEEIVYMCDSPDQNKVQLILREDYEKGFMR